MNVRRYLRDKCIYVISTSRCAREHTYLTCIKILSIMYNTMCMLYSGKHNNIIPYSKYIGNIIYYISTTRWPIDGVIISYWDYCYYYYYFLYSIFFLRRLKKRTYLNIYYRYLRMHTLYYKRFFKRIIIIWLAHVEIPRW